ncbi:Uu.00g095890.m01.CDS01 [Anthostomella pinea]|uniref:Uu.00g095890.m01.CDS01 n=1 Tax=Anthostomella pinea TaxID=933095 RepID=A0AAI8VD41_9PEZI|nr:Uu.00g095890.m01.CDS01 [Anthostomella pinea]
MGLRSGPSDEKDDTPMTDGAVNDTPMVDEAVNVILPIGGIGSRFAKQGYRYPKPLINIVGRPIILWLIDNLQLRKDDTVWMAINEDVDEVFRVGQLVSKAFPKLDIRLVKLRHQTKGASETLYVVSQSMTREHLTRKTVSLDCDTIYWADILGRIRALPSGCGGCFYFRDAGDNPIFSYLKTEQEAGLERIVDIQEKKAISRKANTGAYVFPSASKLRTWAAQNLDYIVQDDTEVGEFYTSHLILLMIHNDVTFLGLGIEKKDFDCVGTPEQLQELLMSLKSSEEPKLNNKRRFCFDLDMTLVGVPAVPGDYSTCPPIEKNIRLVQQLHKAGHYIIIQTARRMRTHHGNVGAVIADVGQLTLRQLDRYKIPFHDVHFGKPYADVYVDDLAVNSNLDTMREIGWLLEDSNMAVIPEQSDASTKKAGMIPARDFNTIQMIGDKVVKSSKSENILGELYFYAHMPQELSHVFPSVYNVDYIPDTKNFTITMENRKGQTFSHLLVGRSITKGRLVSLLKALHTIHSAQSNSEPSLNVSSALAAKFDAHSLERADHHVNIYANYGAKLRSRYDTHRERYDALGPVAASLFSRLNEFLDTYEAEDKGVHAQVIHGDPVFSNAILSKDEKLVSFIDVRCQLENTLTPEGDIHYDLAKVLQSLCGYDHILFMSANKCDLSGYDGEGATPLLDQPDADLLETLRGVFFEYLEGSYKVRLHRKTLYRITASLFFSLIPLHRPELGAVFLRLCKETLDKASGISPGIGSRTASVMALSRTLSGIGTLSNCMSPIS